MRARPTAAAVLCALFILATGVARAEETVLPGADVAKPGEVSQAVVLEGLTIRDEGISGTLVNTSETPVRNVKLVVQHHYRWPNEYKPGDTDPSRAEPVTIHAEIPPGGRFSFTQSSHTPPPLGDGGHFETEVAVIGFEKVFPPVVPPPPAAPAPPAQDVP